MLIYIGGVPGVGKSTVIKKLVKILQNNKIKSEAIRGLPILCKLAGGISEETFRSLPDNIRQKFQPKMREKLYQIDKNDSESLRFIDTHFVFFENNSLKYSHRLIFPKDYSQLKLIILIEADIDKILTRRKMDFEFRKDRIINANIIAKQKKLERDEVYKQSKEIKVPIIIQQNNNNIKNVTNELFKKILDILDLNSKIN